MGISGSDNRYSDADDAKFQAQIDRIRAEEKAASAKPKRKKKSDPEQTAGDVIDLMDLLQQSLKRQKGRRKKPEASHE